MRAPFDPYGAASPAIDQQLGDAFQVVRFVARHIPEIASVAYHMEGLYKLVSAGGKANADLLGLPPEALNLGEMEGSIIPDDSTVYAALQIIATFVENLKEQTDNLLSDMGNFVGTTIPDQVSLHDALQALETAIERVFSEAPVLSTQEQAEEGTDNTTVMSPLRTAQAIAAQTESKFDDIDDSLAARPTAAALALAGGAATIGTSTGETVEASLARLSSLKIISLFQFMTEEEILDVTSGTPTLDVAHAFQALVDYCFENKSVAYIPDVNALLGSQIVSKVSVSILCHPYGLLKWTSLSSCGWKVTGQGTGTRPGYASIELPQLLGPNDYSAYYTNKVYSVAGCSFTGSISGTTLTVSAISGGRIGVGSPVTGSGVAAGTKITGVGSGNGNTGTYAVNVNQNVASTAMNAAAFTGIALHIEDCIWTNVRVQQITGWGAGVKMSNTNIPTDNNHFVIGTTDICFYGLLIECPSGATSAVGQSRFDTMNIFAYYPIYIRAASGTGGVFECEINALGMGVSEEGGSCVYFEGPGNISDMRIKGKAFNGYTPNDSPASTPTTMRGRLVTGNYGSTDGYANGSRNYFDLHIAEYLPVAGNPIAIKVRGPGSKANIMAPSSRVDNPYTSNALSTTAGEANYNGGVGGAAIHPITRVSCSLASLDPGAVVDFYFYHQRLNPDNIEAFEVIQNDNISPLMIFTQNDAPTTERQGRIRIMNPTASAQVVGLNLWVKV